MKEKHDELIDNEYLPATSCCGTCFRRGTLSQPAPAKRLQAGSIQRLKVMGSLDLTQTRRPQDGKFRFKHGSQPIDVRMSVIPTIHGENVVLRLLARQTKIAGFAELGMAREIAEATQSSLKSPYGLFLVTGPTGSGKTTTLYTALNSLNDPSRNIMTIEDPVELRLRYVRQVQVQSGRARRRDRRGQRVPTSAHRCDRAGRVCRPSRDPRDDQRDTGRARNDRSRSDNSRDPRGGARLGHAADVA